MVTHSRNKCTPQFCQGARGELINGPAATTPFMAAKVLALGEPPDTVVPNREALAFSHYIGARNWTIVMPPYWIGLPIPIPAGHRHTDLYFKDGLAQKAGGSEFEFLGSGFDFLRRGGRRPRCGVFAF